MISPREEWPVPLGEGFAGLPVYLCHTLIIGSGAASLAAAERLHRLGVEDLLILTDNLKGGTSRNTGSDKQTYYRMDDSGSDSPYDMARALSSGGCMHGDIALTEAQNSLNCFYHLVSLGVDFPFNKYGGYTGYKTDHDPRSRGISLGPYTSREMHRALLREVRERKIPIAEHRDAQLILTRGDRVIGALALHTKALESPGYGLEIYLAENTVLGVGGPGGLYETSVYPPVQRGGIGIALEAGAEAANLTESQFGIASTRFRWNLSGSYQQVLPCYYSTDRKGEYRRYFLRDYFSSAREMGHAQFLKGYQWPLDPGKLEKGGSSLIDLLVYIEREVKDRRVFLDFRINPRGPEGDPFILEQQHPDVLDYLRAAGVQGGTPLQRLRELNQPAIDLYADHGIDLSAEPLEIAVCAQHNNGGLAADIWWESANLKHLFPIGEVNGSHGIYRPGGSALNAGQVGALRASLRIARAYRETTLRAESCRDAVLERVIPRLRLLEGLVSPGADKSEVFRYREALQKRMTRNAGPIRDPRRIDQACRDAWAQWDAFSAAKVPCRELVPYSLKNRQLALAHCLYLEAVRDYMQRRGGSRGSFLVVDQEGAAIHAALDDRWRCRREDPALKSQIQALRYAGPGKVEFRYESCRPIPEDSFWFETNWKSYLNNTLFEESL